MFDHLELGASAHSYNLARLKADRIYKDHEQQYADRPLETPTPHSFVERISEGGEKTPALMLHRHLSRAVDVFPDLRVVHLVRDPRDVARSSIGMGWAGNVYYGVDHWSQTEDEWQACKGRLAPEQVLEVFYEDLIIRPQEILEKIVGFVGHAYDPEMLNYDLDSTYSKPDPSLTVQWKSKQTAQEVGLVEAKIGSRLSQAGYAPSGHPQIQPQGMMKAGLWLKNKRAVWAVRVSRYGLLDPLTVAVSTKLGLPGISSKAQMRMDKKIVKYLK